MPDPRALIAAARTHLQAGLEKLVQAMTAAETDDFDAWAAAASARNETRAAVASIDQMDPLEADIGVWVVAQDKTPWELRGIFTSEDAARALCTEPEDCLWRVRLDTDLGRETTVFPAEYPVKRGGHD